MLEKGMIDGETKIQTKDTFLEDRWFRGFETNKG
jgi:hypothetical protein